MNVWHFKIGFLLLIAALSWNLTAQNKTHFVLIQSVGRYLTSYIKFVAISLLSNSNLETTGVFQYYEHEWLIQKCTWQYMKVLFLRSGRAWTTTLSSAVKTAIWLELLVAIFNTEQCPQYPLIFSKWCHVFMEFEVGIIRKFLWFDSFKKSIMLQQEEIKKM
jgi:hypothetical protein